MKHNSRYGGKLVAGETVNLDRYTGELNTLYYFDPPEQGSSGYVAFQGTCQRATPKF